MVLSNTVGKLAEKCIVSGPLQNYTTLFHNRQYGSRKGRSAINAMMLTVPHAEQAIREGKRALRFLILCISILDILHKKRIP